MSRRETLLSKSPLDAQDALLVVGLAAVVVGIALFSVAAALIAGGALLAVLAIAWPK